MAGFRELICNARDEPNSKVLPSYIQPEEGKTTVIIDAPFCNKVWEDRHNIILDTAPNWKFGDIEVHDKNTIFPYYKGIRVGVLQMPAQHIYNVVGTHLSLTEDRIISSPWDYHRIIGRCVVQCDSEEFITRFVTAPEGCLENLIDMDHAAYAPKKAFLDAMSKLPFGRVTNSSAIKVYKKYTGKEYLPDETPLTAIEQQQLQRAREFLQRFGFDTSKESVIVTKDLRDEVLGIVYQDQIYLNRRVFMMGTKMVAGTLFEEFIHKTRNLHDECRPMQNFLIDQIMSMGEQITGAPL